jgi:hypothetical protein
MEAAPPTARSCCWLLLRLRLRLLRLLLESASTIRDAECLATTC